MPKNDSSKEQLIHDLAVQPVNLYVQKIEGSYYIMFDNIALTVISSEWLDAVRQEVVKSTALRAAEIAAKFVIFNPEMAQRISEAILSDFDISDQTFKNTL